MAKRRRIGILFQGNLTQFISGSKNPSFQLKGSLFHCNPCYSTNNNNNHNNNEKNNDVGSKGRKFLDDSVKVFTEMLDNNNVGCKDRNFMTDPVKLFNKKTFRGSQLLDDDVTQIKQDSDYLKQIVIDNYSTASSAIECYCRLGESKLGFTVLGSCFKQGIEPHGSMYNTLLEGFIREGKTHEAERLFCILIQNRLLEPDVVIYNTMIEGLCKIGNNYTAIALLRLMDHHGNKLGVCKPNVVTYNTIIHSLCNETLIAMDDALGLLNEMVVRKQITPNVFTYNSLIYALSKLSRWDEVSMMLKQMDDAKIYPQLETFNIIVDALCKQRLTNEAQLVINVMLGSKSFPPDIVTYNSLIEGYCLRHEMTAARAVFDSLPSKSIKPKIDSYNKLLDGYLKDIKIHEACDLYEDLINKTKLIPDVVTFFIMYRVGDLYQCPCKTIDEFQSQLQLPHPSTYETYLGHLGCHESALVLFRLMDGSELNSNEMVYVFLIKNAFKYRKPDSARRLLHHLFLKGLEPSVTTYMYMMSGFCDQGSMMKDATLLHLKMLKTNARPFGVINNTLIKGYLKYKPFDVTKKLLDEMREKGYRITASNISLYWDQVAARQPDSKARRMLLKIKPPKDWYDVRDTFRTYADEYDEMGLYWGPVIKHPYNDASY